MKFIIRPFAEIMIKSKPVRKKYMQALQRNIRIKTRDVSENIKISIFYDKLEVNLKDTDLMEQEKENIPAIKKILSRTPGVESFLEVESHEICDMDLMVEKAAEIYLDQIKDKTFCVRIKRTGKHEFTSTQLERHIGGGLLKKLDALGINGKVQMRNPEVTVSLVVKDENLYVIKSTGRGLGGYPIGMQEKVVSLLSGGFDSGVAAYSLMKRGCKVDFLFFNLGGSAHELGVKQVAYYLNNQFSAGYRANIITVPFENVVKELVTNTDHKYRAIILKRCMLKIADILSKENEYYAIVKGDSLGQVSSQTLKNMFAIDRAAESLVLRPLITFNKQEIIDISKQIGTYDFACNMPEYCGVISNKPATGASLEKVLKEEARFDDSLLTQAFENKKVECVTDILNQVQNHSDDIEYKNFPTDEDIIIDIRDPQAIAKTPFSVKGRDVLQIPFFDINNEFAKLDQTKKYLLYCDKGVMSKLHGLYLLEKGFTNIAVLQLLESDKVCGTL
ncbi:MAG: tRNA 4-thiouridine(8) synthase ThiI [Candidatus Gracilibacteria bacterium]|nr:tRNA 4-thiouridine(8) synthase ThiI [Candidatus Gracilibacteria bacterium]